MHVTPRNMIGPFVEKTCFLSQVLRNQSSYGNLLNCIQNRSVDRQCPD